MQLDKHGALESLLALSEVLNRVVERVHDPHQERRQRHGEWEDKDKDPRAALVDLDEDDAHRVEDTKDEMHRCQDAHSCHHGADGRSNHTIAHGDD